jgi:hypothetical protein
VARADALPPDTFFPLFYGPITRLVAVPEPSSLALCGVAFSIGLTCARARRAAWSRRV